MTINIERQKSTRGPNVWCRRSVTQILVDLGSPVEGELWHCDALADRLTSFVNNELVDPFFSRDPKEPIPFVKDRSPADLLGQLVLNLQRSAGYPVTFWITRPITDRSCEIVVEQEDEIVGSAAVRLAVHAIDQMASGEATASGSYKREVTRFATIATTRKLENHSHPIVDAARKRGIPVDRLDPSGGIVELGNGAFRRRILGSITSRTSSIGESIGENKYLTNLYLRSAGLPVPDGAMARTVEQAIAIAEELGFPVVVKPVDSARAHGVSVDVRDADEIREVFEPAMTASRSGRVLVERYIQGNEYRSFVVGDRIASVSLRTHPQVVGDGRHTVRQLIDSLNRDPRCGPRDTDPLRPVVVDDRTMKVLARQELSLDSIPAVDRIVLLKPFARTPGGQTRDRTGVVHPDNAAMILQAARVLDLDIVTVDFIAHDIAESIWSTSGAIIECNTGSGFRNEIYPAEGQSRDMGSAVVEMLFPPGQPVRVPIVAVTGDLRTADVVARLIARVLSETGAAVGLVSTSGLVIDGRRVRGVGLLDPTGVTTLLNNPATEVVVAQVDTAQITEHGMGMDYCDVAVLMSLSGIVTPIEQPVETVVTESVATDGALVLNAEDPATASFSLDHDRLTVLFALDPDSERVRDHLARRGKAVVVRHKPDGDAISVIEPHAVTDLFPAMTPGIAADLPAESSSVVLLAAAAAAVAHGVPLDVIRRALP